MPVSLAEIKLWQQRPAVQSVAPGVWDLRWRQSPVSRLTVLVPVPVCGGGLYDKALRELPSQALREKMGLFGSHVWPKRGHIYSFSMVGFLPRHGEGGRSEV